MNVNGVEDYSGMFLLTNDRGQSIFSPVGFLPSVNANSANKDLAVDFMRFLISEEMQSSTELLFNPVHINASAEMAALLLADVRAGGYAAAGFDLENNVRLFNELAEHLGIVTYSDHFVNTFVRNEIKRYFDGEVSAEQAARNLQSRLNTYLQE
jgi:multiple sugar transport system substrate-binding protein